MVSAGFIATEQCYRISANPEIGARRGLEASKKDLKRSRGVCESDQCAKAHRLARSA